MAPWQLWAALFQSLCTATVLYVMPPTRGHLTLWLNVLFSAYFFSAAWRSTQLRWLLHSVAFLAAHALVSGYLLALRASGGGDMRIGFDKIDTAQWWGNAPLAAAVSFVMHFWPMVLLQYELTSDSLEVGRIYGRKFVRSSSFALVALVVLGEVYNAIQRSKHGTDLQALAANYKIPAAEAETLQKTVLCANLVMAAGTHLWLRFSLGRQPDVKRNE